MYISGNQYNFENRLHYLCSSGWDISKFQIEGNSYTNATWENIFKWNQEFRKLVGEISGVAVTGNYIQNTGV